MNIVRLKEPITSAKSYFDMKVSKGDKDMPGTKQDSRN